MEIVRIISAGCLLFAYQLFLENHSKWANIAATVLALPSAAIIWYELVSAALPLAGWLVEFILTRA